MIVHNKIITFYTIIHVIATIKNYIHFRKKTSLPNAWPPQLAALVPGPDAPA